ncbi:MAG: SulP family inorganic anion transporter [Pyrinomonadaceae bacterium]
MNHHPKSSLERLFPFIGQLNGYSGSKLSRDFIAGLTVSVVLIPQVMAYAILAGLPPVYGLYAAFLGTAVAALWGSNSQLSTGPVALVSFLVAAGLAPIAKPESPEYIALAVVLAFLIGAIQLMMGSFKLGFIMNFISHSVIAGFTTAAAIIIATTQIPGLLGFKTEKHEVVLADLFDILSSIGKTHFPTLAIGLSATIFIIFCKRKISKAFPGGLVMLAAGILLSYLIDLESSGVAIIGSIEANVGFPAFPKVSVTQLVELFPSALVIATVGFLEAFAISKSIAAKTKEKIDVNQELIGQGLGNLASCIFKGYPIAGSFSRTAVNFNAGAATCLSSVFVSVFVLITILYLTPLLHFLPRAILSAIVISALVDLIEFGKFRETFKLSGIDGIVITTTFVFAFVSQPDHALIIGILVSLILFLRKTIAAEVVPLVFHFEEERFRKLDESNRKKEFKRMLILRIDMSVFFANAHNISDQIEHLVELKGSKLEYLVINYSGVNYMDVSACEVLGELFDELKARGIKIFSMYRKRQIREIMEKSGVEDKFVMLKDIKGFKHEFIIQKNTNYVLD